MSATTEADTIKVRRARMDSIVVYDVTEHELETLQKGGEGSTYLNLCLSLLSIAASFLLALLTTSIESDRQFTVFVVVTVVGFIGALVLGVLWWLSRQTIADVVLGIKQRMPLDESADVEPTDPESVEKVPPNA